MIVRRPGGYAVTVGARDGREPRTLLAVADTALKAPAGIAANQPSAWHAERWGADMVIIAHAAFVESVEPLKRLRQAQGLRVAVVDIEDVYDEFSYGQKTPQALKDFLAWARGRWRRAPRFVLLVGGASFDPRNYLGLEDFDYVPTKLVDTALLETASDDWFGDAGGEGIPDVAVGRLPVRSAEQAARMIDKIVGYEQTSSIRGREVLLVADNNDVFDFEGAVNGMAALVPPDTPVQIVFRRDRELATVRQEIVDGLNRGPLIANYIGHGSVEVWAGEGLLTAADARALGNADRLSFVISMNCLNGFFHDPYTESLAEALLNATGGGIAVWASSGLTEPAGQALLNQALMRLLFDGQDRTVGEAAQAAKRAVNDLDIRRTWIFFGDPATRLQ